MQGTATAQNVRERVGARIHTLRVAGRHPSFTTEELDVLRSVARQLKEENGWSGAELGARLGIKQQNASRFVAAGSTSGMDRKTANELAKAAGFRDVEHLLLEAGVLAEMKQPKQKHALSEREVAIRVARQLGYPDAAVQAIVARFANDATSFGKPIRWWVDKIVIESLQHEADSRPLPKRVLPKSGTHG